VRPSSLIHLYRVRLRARLVQELLAIAGIAVGVALVFAALVASTSLTGSVRQITSGIVGEARLQLSARSPQGFDERLLAETARVAGVKVAVPVLEAQANVSGPRGSRSVTLIGGDPRQARAGSRLVRSFAAQQLARQRALALPASMADALGLGLGERVRLQVGTRTVRAGIGLVLHEQEIGALVHSPVVIAPLAYAQDLSGMEGRLSRVFVVPEAGRDRSVAAALRALAGDRATVRPADDDLALFERAAYPTNRSTATFAIFGALVGFLFAFSAVLLTVPQRRGLVNDLRLAGHESWVQVEVLLFDALVLGLLGSLAGLALGDQLSRHLFGGVPGYLAYAFSIGSQRVVTWHSIAVASGAGVAAAFVAVLAPLRDILSRDDDAARAPRGRRADRTGIVVALSCAAATSAVVVLAPQAVIAGIVLLTVALLLVLLPALRASTSALGALVRHARSPVPTLALLELRSGASRLRTLALAATGAVAVFATVAVGGTHADLQRGLDASASEIDANGDVWASFPGATNAFAIVPFAVPPETVAALGRLPGVASVGRYRGSFLDVGHHRAWVQAPPRAAPAPIPPSQLREGDLERASARLRSGRWVVLSEALADELAVGIGDRVTLPTPVRTPLRLAGVSTNLGWPPGAIVLSADAYARAWDGAAPSALQIELEPGASPRRVSAAVRRTLGPRLPALVETMDERVARHFEASREGLSRLTQISVLVLVSAMVAMAAAMGGLIWQRRPAIAALKVHGYPEGELWRALLLESCLLLGTGCLVGAVFGLYGQILMTRALEAITGFPVLYSAAGVVALAIIALVTAVAVAMIALPGWLAVRVRPAPGGAVE
jgi:putative ABC transport system permease protein